MFALSPFIYTGVDYFVSKSTYFIPNYSFKETTIAMYFDVQFLKKLRGL